MTDWHDVAGRIIGSWPQTASWGEATISAYVAELARRGLTPDVAMAALDRANGEFPPSAPSLCLSAERALQGDVPTFMAAQRLIARRISMLPYRNPEQGMPALVERLQHDGHEVIARFAAEMGAEALRQMPDEPTPASTGQSVALSRYERAYQQCVAGWREDARPGLAAARAHSELERGGAFSAVAMFQRKELTT